MGCAVPCVFIAGCHMVCGVIVLGNSEVQRVSAGAAFVVCIVVGVCATLSVVDIVPCILFASILMIGVVSAVIDCEVEGVNVSAS